MSSAYLRLLIFLLAILIPACASSSLAFRIMCSEYKLNKKGDNIQPWCTPLDLEPVCFSTSSSNCCFLTYIQISQEEGQVVWYSHFLKNFPQFLVIHTFKGFGVFLKNFPQFLVIHTFKGFGVVNKAEVDVFLELSCFFDDPMDIGDLISGSSALSKSSLNIWKFSVYTLLNPGLENFEHYFASM